MFHRWGRKVRCNDKSCPAFAIGCNGCSPISVLKPEIVIEERRWCPYPMVIRHYIEKPKEKTNCIKKLYRKLQADRRQREEKKRDRKRAQEARERLERERCLRELRRLHSYHQSLCNKTQSLPGFSKDVKDICSKAKVRWKSRSVSARRDKEKRPKNRVNFFRIVGNTFCSLAIAAMVGATVLFVL